MNSISMVNLETGQQQGTVQRETFAGGPEILAGGDKFKNIILSLPSSDSLCDYCLSHSKQECSPARAKPVPCGKNTHLGTDLPALV